MKSIENKESKLWQAWTATLSHDACTALNKQPVMDAMEPPAEVPPNEELRTDYDLFYQGLSSQAQDGLDFVTTSELPPATELKAVPRFCLVISPDGEMPNAILYKNVEDLARKVSSLQDTDTAVWAFYGVPMPVTMRPQRHLLLPDGQTAMEIPLYAGAPTRRIPIDLAGNLRIQEDGHLGHEALLRTVVEEGEAQVAAAPPEDDELEE